MADHTDLYACARAWSALTAAHALITERLGTALTRACGLSINEFEVLLRLEQAEPPELRPADLLPAVRLTQPSLSRMIIRLEQQGLLRREPDPADGRGVLVAITDAGRELFRRAVPVHSRTIQDALLDQLSPAEHDSLTAMLDRIATPPDQRKGS
ncbi:MarR family transcriptional regulator [Sphaerisporangium sp. TRM90804]|uniref:MarR family winged helix-turn-helix transcriptional regulator n=1 Tax=Sphaerisporangium sp. TRM90804 TaxID=3031113 RepID=UPI00244A4E7D|nr:MarR family transcriptional regulator [Sphaerisporangium sp. TRM90804]MDH2423903.1 MarR family transcriptional regulator [Sphaerisporangium sp. TRM90804]